MSMTSRRDLVRQSLCLGASAVAGALFAAPSADARRGKKLVTAEQWMDRWMAVNRAPGGILQISRFREPIYFLLKPIGWIPNHNQQQYEKVDVPVGFVTDFASIPRVFWSFLPTDGDYAYAAVIHDFLYWTQSRPREVADQIFRMSMQDFKISSATIEVIYQAVRLGGGSAWSENAKLKAAGEGRVLKVFPTDPTTSWKDWKQRTGVFADT
ncbi:MAG: DUF1353 domain-containing protein [Candidatus Sulfotelmatobacter sp.]